MDTDGHRSEEEGRADALTGAVIGAAFEVANVLGSGFLEKVHERALMRELALRGIGAKAQVSFPVLYKERYIGEYVSDLVVQEKLIVELKCVDRFSNGTHCAMYQLSQGFPSRSGFTHQLSKAETGMETYHTGR
jgi:GxxExxY protein